MKDDQFYYEEDRELPPFNTFMRTYGEDLSSIRTDNLYYDEISPSNLDWLHSLFGRRYITGHYDYQNLYDPLCDTAVYYFLEDIVIDFSDMEEDDDCYPFGWFDFFAYCDKIGVKLPTYGEDGGKYGKSIRWE